MQVDPEALDWKKGDGLIPAIVQDATTGQVLMLGYMNRESLDHTVASGKVTFWSRSREELWTKGETSGNTLVFREALTDCDQDALLIRAKPMGPVCHTGSLTCFEDKRYFGGLAFLSYLEELIHARVRELPKGSYTSELVRKGTQQILKKVGEEAIEVLVSAQEEPQRTVEEIADLVYHLLVLTAVRKISLEDVVGELAGRHGAERKS